MAQLKLTEIIEQLVKFFSNKAPKHATIDSRTNVRQLLGLHAYEWRALAEEINGLSRLRKAQLKITQTAMLQMNTIGEIAKALVASRKREGLKVHSSREQGKKRTSLVTPKRGTLPTAPEGGARRPSVTPSSDRVSARPKGTEVDADYTVWFGTNRKPVDPEKIELGFSASRDTKIHHGFCRVFIPHSHKIGSTGSSWWERYWTGMDDRLKILQIDELVPSSYWKAVSAALAAVKPDERDGVIFVHGYNVSFNNAAARAAQIGFDLSVKGAMAFFSWPSRGATKSYVADEATIESSEPYIAEFIQNFVQRSGAKRVHIIAHSMGNRGVLRAINRIAEQTRRRTGVKLDQIILAAADVDADTFRNLCAAYRRVSKRTTLYVSTKDLAVEASRWLHNFARAGLMPPIMIAPGIDTINVTNADLTMLGHGYVADGRGVLEDMHQLLVHGAPPNRRFALRQSQTVSGEAYWTIGR